MNLVAPPLSRWGPLGEAELQRETVWFSLSRQYRKIGDEWFFVPFLCEILKILRLWVLLKDKNRSFCSEAPFKYQVTGILRVQEI